MNTKHCIQNDFRNIKMEDIYGQCISPPSRNDHKMIGRHSQVFVNICRRFAKANYIFVSIAKFMFNTAVTLKRISCEWSYKCNASPFRNVRSVIALCIRRLS